MKDYKETLLMMQTEFPMRGNLGQNEPNLRPLYEKSEAVFVCDGTICQSETDVVFTGRTEFLDEYPELAARVLKAIQKAEDWINESEENKDEAAKLVAEINQTEEKFIRPSVDKIDLHTDITERDVNNLDGILQFMKDQDLISDANFQAIDAIDYSYLESAGLHK